MPPQPDPHLLRLHVRAGSPPLLCDPPLFFFPTLTLSSRSDRGTPAASLHRVAPPPSLTVVLIQHRHGQVQAHRRRHGRHRAVPRERPQGHAPHPPPRRLLPGPRLHHHHRHLPQKPKLITECQAVDVVVLTYACDRLSTLERLSTYWLLELRPIQLKAPVIMVGCKLDLRDDQQNSLEQTMAPIMQSSHEIETCIECFVLL